MLSRRTAVKLGAALVAPFVAHLPATVAPAQADSDEDVTDEVVFGPLFRGRVAFFLDGATAGTYVDAWGGAFVRNINGQWFVGLSPEVRAKLDAAMNQEAQACRDAGLPAFDVV